jgi:hypothetical protein
MPRAQSVCNATLRRTDFFVQRAPQKSARRSALSTFFESLRNRRRLTRAAAAEMIRKLSRTQQRFVIQMLDTVLQQNA